MAGMISRQPAARGESPAAFGRRCIPADCVAPPSNIPDILSRRALSSGRLAALGAAPDFHHWLLVALVCVATVVTSVRAENWPQWRGPSLNGTSAEKDLPVRWSKTENITWVLDLPAWSG